MGGYKDLSGLEHRMQAPGGSSGPSKVADALLLLTLYRV